MRSSDSALPGNFRGVGDDDDAGVGALEAGAGADVVAHDASVPAMVSAMTGAHAARHEGHDDQRHDSDGQRNDDERNNMSTSTARCRGSGKAPSLLQLPLRFVGNVTGCTSTMRRTAAEAKLATA